MSQPLTLRYQFDLPQGDQIQYLFEFDGQRYQLKSRSHTEPPPWALMHCQQCRHCPYQGGSGPKHCPAAVQLARVVKDLDVLASYDDIHVHIETPERTIDGKTNAQSAISSLLGLLFASSGCPHTEFLLPMARFHLPLASPEETLWRASGSFLLAQYFKQKNNEPSEGLEGLTRRYENLEVLNSGMAKRLRNQVDKDSCLNAIVLLDNYAKMYPMFLEKSLSNLRNLYQGYLTQ